MDFFSKISEELDKACVELAGVGVELAKVTKEATENASLHAQVVAEEAKIREQYRIIGQLYYEEWKDKEETSEILSDAYTEAFEKISISKWKIENAKKTIANNKGGICCPQCGKSVEKTASFCSKCGKKVK